MKLSEVCIQRPVLSWVFTFVLLLLGAVGFYRLPVQKMPNIDNVFMTIETQMPGVGPDIIESQITRHIEDAVSGIEGIDTISSRSSSEDSKVLIEFRPGISMDNAVNNVRDRLGRVKEKLPQANLRTEPMINRSKSDERPIMTLALTSTKSTPAELYDYAENEIKQQIESIAGVGRIDISGASSYVMKIELDPLRMAGQKLNVNDVRDAISNQNFESPAGRIESRNRMYNVTTVASLTKPEDFDEVIIRGEKGRIVRIKDIGHAYENADDKRTRTRFNGEQGIQISISKQSNANPLQIAKEVKEKIIQIKKRLPKETSIHIASDQTKYIEKSIKNVYWSIFEASILVVLVVFFFLKSARASLIPLVTIPVSVIGVAFFMYILGYTLNMFTLFAMVLAVGLVVDDAIVVMENIHRHIEDGIKPFQASIKGIREVGFSVIAMTLTLVAVYLPIPLGSGKLAKNFTEFAITLAGSVLISGFVALTLSPMMCSRLLVPTHTPNPQAKKSRWDRFKERVTSEAWLHRVESLYENTLTQALNQKKKVMLSALGVALVGLWVFAFLKSEFTPTEDTRMIRISAHSPASATLKFTERYLKETDEILEKIPEIENRISNINNPNVDILIELVELPSSIIKRFIALFQKHVRSTEEVIIDLQKKFRKITGFDLRIDTGGEGESNKVEFIIRGGSGPHELLGLSREVSSQVLRLPVVRNILQQSTADNQDYVITMNRDKIANIQKNPKEIAQAIQYLIKGENVTKFKRDNKQYDVNLQVYSEFKQNPDDILRLYIRGGTQKEPLLIPLSELVSVDSRTGPHEIYRHYRQRSFQMTAVLKPGHTISEAIDAIEAIAANVLPENAYLDFTGETRRYLTETRSMILVFFLSLCFIYLVMAAQFESWRDPFIIFFSVPLSLVGGAFALAQIDKGTLNMYSFIGFVTLVGLITKHGILIVDFANRLREHGTLTINEAIIKASSMRLRPILMTTFAMVLGAVPLMFGGVGNESRRQLGSVIIGGMSLGTLFTLFVVPTMYVYLTSSKRGQNNHNA